MNNKKLSRLLEPNLKLYFLCLLAFSLAAITASWPLALAEGLATVALYVYSSEVNKKRRQGILQYIDSVTGSVDTASKSTLINSPLPIMVFRPDTGEVIWSNENGETTPAWEAWKNIEATEGRLVDVNPVLADTGGIVAKSLAEVLLDFKS